MPVENRQIGFVESEELVQQIEGEFSSQGDANAHVLAYGSGDIIAGRYRLIRLIGQGGMGVVWEAHSDALDIRVAVKLIHRAMAKAEEQQRLIVEAKAAARLVDPGVVRVFDRGETLSGESYIVMEYLEGQDLATRLYERGHLPPIEAVRTLLPIVRALGTAHAASIVHRDVKPENVFLAESATGEEQPKLLDFGIAKMEIPWEKRLTQAGSALGSPNYMSPEQARGEEVDQRADLWGVCVVLYEAITERLPFDGSGYNAVMYSILSSSPMPFPELGVDEPELWDIIARGLERDLSRRWQTSAELARALSEWLIARGVGHDVSGVSLQASLNNHRASHVRTLETVRPPSTSTSGEQSASSRSASALRCTTPGRLVGSRSVWSRRPRWFVPVMSGMAFCAATLGIARAWKSPSVIVAQPALSVEPATAPIGLPAIPITAVDPTFLPIEPSGAASVPPKPTPSAPKGSPKKAPSAAKGESFKSPFD